MILLQVPERAAAPTWSCSAWSDGVAARAGLDHGAAGARPPRRWRRYVAAEQPGRGGRRAGHRDAARLGAVAPCCWSAWASSPAADLRVAGVALGRAISALPETPSGSAWRSTPRTPRPARRWPRAWCSAATGSAWPGTPRTACTPSSWSATLDRAGLTAGDEAADAAGWARDLGNTPANELTPARFGELAEQQLTPAGCTVTVHDEDWLREQGFGGVLAVGGGSAARPRLIEVSYRAAPAPGRAEAAARGAGRQGHHLRHRRAEPQAGRRHADDAHRHVRRRRGARRGPVRGHAEARGGRHGAGAGRRERGVRHRDAALGRDRAVRRPDHRDRQHRRRGPAGAGRRARPTRWPGSSRTP